MEQGQKYELRLNNIVFHCRLENKVYNIKEMQPYGVSLIAGVVPQQSGLLQNMEIMLICEKCYKENSDGKGLNFKEPLPIVAAPAGALRQIKNMTKQ